jgi:hypothetical protein
MKISIILYNLSVVLAIIVGSNLVVCQETATEAGTAQENVAAEPIQSGPLIDLLGTKLQSLEILDEQSAQVKEHYTNEALAGKSVIGLYFSADWYVSLSRSSSALSPLYLRTREASSSMCIFEGASLLTVFFCYNNRAQKGAVRAVNLLRSLFHSTKE